MSETNRNQVLIPAKFGNGHLVLTDQAVFHYKQTTEYNRKGQFTIKWAPGRDNLADYFTKHRSTAHHRRTCSDYLVDKYSPRRHIK